MSKSEAEVPLNFVLLLSNALVLGIDIITLRPDWILDKDSLLEL